MCSNLLLQVTSVFDKTAEEMLEKISEFSTLDGHGSLVALVIMSHGNKRGDIAGVHGATCSVQEVIDSLCQPHLDPVTNVRFTKSNCVNCSPCA